MTAEEELEQMQRELAAREAQMDQVSEQRTELVITKRGKPVARLTPIEADAPGVLGCMVGTAEVLGDLVEPLVSAGEWESSR